MVGTRKTAEEKDLFTRIQDWLLETKGSSRLKDIKMNWHKTLPASDDYEKLGDVIRNIEYSEKSHDVLAHNWASRIHDINTACRWYEALVLMSTGRAYGANISLREYKATWLKLKKALEDRAWEIAGRTSRTAPKKPSTPKQTWQAPDASGIRIPMDAKGWQLYSGSRADTAGRALGVALTKTLAVIGKKVTPHNTDDKNAANLHAILSAFTKVRERYAEQGALDSEPRNVMLDIVEKYLETYLSDWKFPKTYNEIENSWY